MSEQNITPHMAVVDAEGRHVGTVDSCHGDLVKLTRGDSADGRHHMLSVKDVERVEGDRVVLRAGVREAGIGAGNAMDDSGFAGSAPGTGGRREMSDAEIVAASTTTGVGTTADSIDRPLFGTSGNGTGMGGSGSAQH